MFEGGSPKRDGQFVPTIQHDRSNALLTLIVLDLLSPSTVTGICPIRPDARSQNAFLATADGQSKRRGKEQTAQPVQARHLEHQSRVDSSDTECRCWAAPRTKLSPASAKLTVGSLFRWPPPPVASHLGSSCLSSPSPPPLPRPRGPGPVLGIDCMS